MEQTQQQKIQMKKRLRPDREEDVDATAKFYRAHADSFMATSPAFRMGGGGIRFKYANVLFDLLPHTPTPQTMVKDGLDNTHIYSLLKNLSPHVLYWLLAYKTYVFTHYDISMVDRRDSVVTVLEYRLGNALHPQLRQFTNRNSDPQKFPEICAFIAKLQQCVNDHPTDWKTVWEQQHQPQPDYSVKYLFENTNPKVLERLYLCIPDEFTPQGTYWRLLCKNPSAARWILPHRSYIEKGVESEEDRVVYRCQMRNQYDALTQNAAPELTELVCHVAQKWLDLADAIPLSNRRSHYRTMLRALLQNYNSKVVEWLFSQPALKNAFDIWFKMTRNHSRNATISDFHYYTSNPHVWSQLYTLWRLGGFERRVKTERAEWSNSPVWNDGDGQRPPSMSTFTADTAVTLNQMAGNKAARNEWEQRVCCVLDDWNNTLFLVPFNQSPQAAAFISAYWDIFRHVRDDTSNTLKPDRITFESALLQQCCLFELDYAAMFRDGISFAKELGKAALHPKRAQKWIDANFDFSAHEEHNYMSCSFP